MSIGIGIGRQVRYKKESAWATAPGASGAQLLRRTQFGLALNKDTYQSAELLSHYQMQDFRHGARRAEGTINGELSPKTYADFLGSLLRKTFVAAPSATGLSITIGAPVSGVYPITRGAGSWLTDGFKVGMVFRLSAGTFNANNLLKNFRIVDITSATVLNAVPDGGTATAEGPIASSTVTCIGKISYVPTTSHTDDSYWIEDWHPSLSISEQYTGMKVGQAQFNLPPTGMSTISLSFLGKDITTATSAYFTSPTAETTTGICAAVNGALRFGTADIATVTGAQFTVNGNISGAQVVGSNTTPAIFQGRVLVNGQLQVYFEDGVLRDGFINESELALNLYVKADGNNGGDFISMIMPRVKVGGAGMDDGEKGLIRTIPFQALYNSAGGSGVKTEQTTIEIQDSAA